MAIIISYCFLILPPSYSSAFSDNRSRCCLISYKSAIPYPDFQQHMQVVGSVLQNMQNQGLLTPTSEVVFTPEVRDAIIHGVKHFVKEFKFDDPRENRREFIEAVVKYGVYATFHIVTDGMFLGAERLALIGTQVHALLQTDFSGMNAKQKAEFIAERVAEIIKMALADQVGRKIIPKGKLGGLSSHSSSTPSTQEAHEAVTPDGVKLPMHVEIEDPLVHNAFDEKSIELNNKSDIVKLNATSTAKVTTKQAMEIAKKLGFNKTSYYSHGQPVFQKGNRFITIDADSHSGGFWKMADSVRNLSSKRTRMGTYDKLLNRIGD